MFRTELPLTPHPQQLPHSARVLTIGSCFSDSIGNRLADFKVETLVNPFGTVFNPISTCKLLRAAAGEDTDWQQHLVEARGRWQSHDLHATLGAESPVDLLQNIQGLVRDTGVFLATADAVVLTLGTAYAYRLLETGEIISNCHKVPADKFEKELLTADEIIAAVAETHAYLRRINPRLRFILTVSPVRHLKETLPLSSVSKSMLRVACHYLSELLPDVSYFPAYELLLDDLRDYRFYASDMLHPSDVAENYIWERFTRTYFDTAFGRFKKEWEGIRQALAHRPLHSAAPEHRQFLETTLARLQRLSFQADLRMELLHVEREIASLPLPPPLPAPEPEEVDEEDFLEEEELQGTDHSRAELLRPGSGLLIEAEEEEPESAEADPEEAYEMAYAGEDLEYAAEDEQADITSASVEEVPARKKKRRSRGGAKRSKRKAARLAAEADAATAVTAVEPMLGQSDSTTEVVEETALPSEEITYISEAELFGKSNRPSATEGPDAVVQEEFSPEAEASAADEETQEATEPTDRNSRRRSRPQRKSRPQDREPRRGNRAALYAVPPADEAPEALAPATAETASIPVAETSVTTTSDYTASEEPATSTSVKSRSRSRGGAERNRGGVTQSHVAPAAELAATEAPQSIAPVDAPAGSVLPSAPTVTEVSPEPANTKPRSRRAPRKGAAAVAPETLTPVVEAVVPEPTAATAVAPAAKKRAPRKAAPTPAPETSAAAPVNDLSVPKASRSRKKPTPAPDVTSPVEEAQAPKKPRPPRRKPAADKTPETPE